MRRMSGTPYSRVAAMQNGMLISVPETELNGPTASMPA